MINALPSFHHNSTDRPDFLDQALEEELHINTQPLQYPLQIQALERGPIFGSIT